MVNGDLMLEKVWYRFVSQEVKVKGRFDAREVKLGTDLYQKM